MGAPFAFVPPNILNPAEVPEGFRDLVVALHQISARAELNIGLLLAVPDVDNAARRRRFRELAQPMRVELNGLAHRLAERSISRSNVELQRWRDLLVRDTRRLLTAISEV